MDPGNVAALAAGIIGYLDDPSAAEQAGAALRDRVTRRYGPDSGMDRLERLYADLVERRA